MSKFHYRDFMSKEKLKTIDMPLGSTPNDFKKLIKLNDRSLPTVCFRKKIGGEPEYLSRIDEWDIPINEGYECYFTTYPNGAGIGEAILVSLIISVVVGVGTYLLTPRPNIGLNQLNNDTSPTYDLTTQGNRVRLNQPKPIHYGTIRAYPDIWSNSWTESIDDDRIYHALLNVGYNYIEIDDFRIDDTDLSTFPWVDYNIRFPGDSPTSRFPKPVITSREIKNVEVEDTDSGFYILNDPNPISLVQYAYLDFVNPRGIYYSGEVDDRGNADRATFADIDLTSLPATIDGAVVTDFLAMGQLNSPDNGWWNYTGAGNPATRHANMSIVGQFQNGYVEVTNGTQAGLGFRQVVRITSMADPKIFVAFDNDKTINETFMSIRISVQEIDVSGANVGPLIYQYHDIQAVSKEPFYSTFSYDHGVHARLKFEVLQGYHYTTNPPLDDNFVPEVSSETLSDVENKTTWIGLRGDLDATEPIAANQTLIEVQIQASGKLNDSNIGIFNCLGKVRLPVYDFDLSSWSTIQTNSPIWAFYDIVTNTEYGMALDGDDYIDLDNLNDIHDSIDGLDLECNTRFDTSMSANEMMAQIVQPMRCIVYQRGGKYLLARAEEKTSINGFFSRENIEEGSLSIDLIPKNNFSPTWYRITYYDSVTSKKETVDCVIPSSLTALQQYDEPFEEIELHTITDRVKVWQYGMYLAAQNKYNNESIRFTTDMEGFFPNPLDFISITHPMLTTTQSGYVQKVQDGIVYLSEPIAFGQFETGLISFKNLDGTCTPYYICKKANNQYAVELVKFSVATEDYTTFPFLTQEDEPLTEETTFTFGLTESSKICIVKEITASGTEKANIECVNHDPRVYTADKPIFLCPELGYDYILHDEFICDAIDCFVNLDTNTIDVQWNGSGYNEFKIRYLFNNDDVESTVTQTVPQGTPGTHSDSYIYTGEPPSRVTVTPVIDITISPALTEELNSLTVVIPIEIA